MLAWSVCRAAVGWRVYLLIVSFFIPVSPIEFQSVLVDKSHLSKSVVAAVPRPPPPRGSACRRRAAVYAPPPPVYSPW